MLGPLLVALFASASQQPQAVRIEDPMRAFSIELPGSWRQMAPMEARALADKTPADLVRRLILTQISRFADVDRWKARGFDGRCLTIRREHGEPAMTEDTLRRGREAAARIGENGVRIAVESLKLTTVGETKNPAIESVLLITSAAGELLARVLEFVVPTGGDTLTFRFRANPEDFAAALPLFRGAAASLNITRPPEGRKELSDKLRMPLIIGGLVGLIFLVLYKMRKG